MYVGYATVRIECRAHKSQTKKNANVCNPASVGYHSLR